MTDAYDCVVVGGGPGGYVAALRAAQLGLRTAVVERPGRLGGRCLHEACIPAKAVLRSADVLDEVRHAAEHGIVVADVTVDPAGIGRRRRSVIGGLAAGVTGLLRRHGVEVVEGDASVRSATSVVVDGARELSVSRGLILATGSVAHPLPGAAFGGPVLDTAEAWRLDSVPASLVVVGGGASGMEVASAYGRLGSAVVVLETADRVLPAEDHEVSGFVAERFRAQGIDLRVGVALGAVEVRGGRVHCAVGSTTEVADVLVVAVGRRPDLGVLAGAAAGPATTPSGHVRVDGRQETDVPGLYAIGDLVPGPALAHKASAEGIIAAEAIAGLPVTPLDHAFLPRATFCAPNVASFGHTEAQARALGYDVVVARTPFSATGAAQLHGTADGMLKLVADRSCGEILGGHVVGHRAPELAQQLLDVRSLEGGFQELARIVHAHPTPSELVAELARAADGWAIHA